VCRNKTTILAFQPPQLEINKRSLWVVDGQFEGSSLILLKNALTTIKPNQTKPNQSPHEIAWQIQSAFKFFEYDSIFTYIAT
jgi:hypothetical protein